MDQALLSLQQYAEGLDYELPEEPVLRGTLVDNSGVYVKCNVQTGLFYASPYDNRPRGVLLAYQSVEHPDLAPLYGHLALDLFASV